MLPWRKLPLIYRDKLGYTKRCGRWFSFPRMQEKDNTALFPRLLLPIPPSVSDSRLFRPRAQAFHHDWPKGCRPLETRMHASSHSGKQIRDTHPMTHFANRIYKRKKVTSGLTVLIVQRISVILGAYHALYAKAWNLAHLYILQIPIYFILFFISRITI